MQIKTHCSTGGVLDGDGESPWVATFDKDILATCIEGVDPSIKGLEIHVPGHRALTCTQSEKFPLFYFSLFILLLLDFYDSLTAHFFMPLSSSTQIHWALH